MIDMAFDINQVGKRWFKVDILKPIEGRLAHEEIGTVEASYTIVTKWEDGKGIWKERKWTLTGAGARKYREGLTEELNRFVDFHDEYADGMTA